MAEKKNGAVNNKLIGRVIIQGDRYFFESKDSCVYDIKQDEIAKRLAYSGEICIFELDKAPKLSASITGRITDIMGKEGDPIPEGLAIATIYNLTHPFNTNAVQQAERMPDEVTEEQWKGYRDLRHIDFVTIDPDTAKDFDDAVHAERNEDGSYTLRVAIANVANYIEDGSPLYYEIYGRGTSAYLGNTVYPMLPEKISNVLCSLNEKTDRVVMCTTARIAPDGRILEYSLEPAVIHSRHRLTYKEADFIRFGHCDTVEDQSRFAGLAARTAKVKPSIDALFEVSDILTRQRKERGALDVTSFKPHFVLDKTGTSVVDVEEEQAEKSTKVIESTAILTNEISGEIAKRLGIPTMYRNHSLPDEMSAAILSERLAGFGLGLPHTPSGESYLRLLRSVKGKNIEEPVTSLVLKSFKEAYYSAENDGHFGLGIKADEFYDSFMEGRGEFGSKKVANDARMRYFKETGSYNGLKFTGDLSHTAYAYSTSPIRNAPSYIIQSQLLDYIMTGNVKYNRSTIAAFADRFSEAERNAAAAEKDYNALLGSIWAKEHLGESFAGRIVNFYPDGMLIKTDEPKNISITVPYEEVRSVRLNQSMIDSMLIKCGMRRKTQHKGQAPKKSHKNKCPLQLGDTLEDLMIYAATTKPPRIFATEDHEKYIQRAQENENGRGIQ